jgi:MtN3 and saliva related transmembrane protein
MSIASGRRRPTRVASIPARILRAKVPNRSRGRQAERLETSSRMRHLWPPAGARRVAASDQTCAIAIMTFAWVDMIGTTAAVLTTVCWLPQAVKIIRDKDTRAISLIATVALTIGIAFWLAYGVARLDGPMIGANVITLTLMLVILALKLRYG